MINRSSIYNCNFICLGENTFHLKMLIPSVAAGKSIQYVEFSFFLEYTYMGLQKCPHFKKSILGHNPMCLSMWIFIFSPSFFIFPISSSHSTELHLNFLSCNLINDLFYLCYASFGLKKIWIEFLCIHNF